MKGWYYDIARRKRIGVGISGEGAPPFVTELNRPYRMALIAEALTKKGYGANASNKIVGTNFRRVFADTWTPRA
jgi:membrane dipeptidase